MKAKERYIWKLEKNDCYSYECIYDNEDKRNLYNNDLVLKILNQQDKKIKRFMRMKNREQLTAENEALKDTSAVVLAQEQLAIDKLEILQAVFASTIIDEVLRNYVCSIIRGEIANLLGEETK